MAHRSDQTPDAAPGGINSVDRTEVGEVLAAMAGHFATRRPADILTPLALQACVAGTVYNMSGRTAWGKGAALTTAVCDALPEAEPACTRSQYAARLRQEAVTYAEVAR